MRCWVARGVRAIGILNALPSVDGLPTGAKALELSETNACRFDARIRRAERSGRQIDPSITYPVLVRTDDAQELIRRNSVVALAKSVDRARQERRARQTHPGKR